MSNDKFYIGQEVRIRDWDDMAQEFGVDSRGVIRCTFHFTPSMKVLCGMSFVITEIIESVVRGHKFGWSISTDMIEPMVPELELDEDTTEIDNFLTGYIKH